MSAPQFLRKTNNLVADMKTIVDPSWRIVGQSPSGDPVYQSIEQRPVSVPDIDPATGTQRVEYHPINGLPIYKRNRVELRDEVFTFTLFDPKNGNVRREPYVEPTAAEIRERDMARRKHDLLAGLVQGLAERDIPVDRLLDSIMGKVGEEDEGEPISTDYPQNYAPGRWRLSNGTTMQGSKVEAAEAEAGLHLVGVN